MENIKKILKERASGLILIMFAVFIVAGVSVSSPKAESKNEQNLSSNNQPSNDTQVLGETNNGPEEVTNTPEDAVSDTVENDSSSQETSEVKSDDKKDAIKVDLKNNAFNELEDHLNKYCHKSGSNNKKGCEQYCLKTKKDSKKDDLYDNLYEKYCKIETTIVIKNKDGKTIAKYNNYRYTSDKDLTVFDFMKMASEDEKFSFKYENYSFGAYIFEINGIGSKVYDGNYWRLSVNGKVSGVGASGCEVSDGDKIEWEYTDQY